jgi:hypothetical protein
VDDQRHEAGGVASIVQKENKCPATSTSTTVKTQRTVDFFTALGFSFVQVHRRERHLHDRQRQHLGDAAGRILLRDVHPEAVATREGTERCWRPVDSRAEVDAFVV